MAKEDVEECKNSRWQPRGHYGNSGGDAVFGLGLIGALVYYLSHVNTFWDVILGILKSLVWPAMFVYHVFTFLKV